VYGKDRIIQDFGTKKTDGESLLGIHSRRWEDNIKIDLQEVTLSGSRKG